MAHKHHPAFPKAGPAPLDFGSRFSSSACQPQASNPIRGPLEDGQGRGNKEVGAKLLACWESQDVLILIGRCVHLDPNTPSTQRHRRKGLLHAP